METQGKMNIWGLLRNILPFVLPYRWLIAVTLVLTLIGSLMAQVNAVVLDRAVDAINALIQTPGGFQWGAAVKILTVISIILLVIAIALIRNTIRLSIYSKRFTVRSMQLVGATEGFIRRPFLRSGVLQGFLGGLLADVLLILMLYGISKRIPDLTLIQDIKVLGAIFVGIIVLGVVLAWFSTRSALNKFLKADLDKLYN